MPKTSQFSQLLKIILPGLGGFIAILILSFLTNMSDFVLLMAPFGASCVLVFLLPANPLAQPKNVILGHMLSTLIGLIVLNVLGSSSWSMALGVGLAIIGMHLCKVVHPPAGGDPILVMLSGASWGFLLTPVLVGSVILAAIGYGYHKLNRVDYPVWARRAG
jgi:CBS-domain-containing membrane protein